MLCLSLLILVAVLECCCEELDLATQRESDTAVVMGRIRQAAEMLDSTVAEALDILSHETRGLKEELASKEKENKKLSLEVQELSRRLLESRRREQHLEQLVSQLNYTLETQETRGNWSQTCEQPRLHDVKKLVQVFSRNKKWPRLRRGLQCMLDSRSEAYSQVHTIDYGSRLPLFKVGDEGYSQLASLLLCAGLDVNTEDGLGYTMLYGAAEGGRVQLVKLLMEHGAHPDVRSELGWTPLIAAAYSGHLEVVQWLVQAGANTTVTSHDGRSALDFARSQAHETVVQYLEPLTHYPLTL